MLPEYCELVFGSSENISRRSPRISLKITAWNLSGFFSETLSKFFPGILVTVLNSSISDFFTNFPRILWVFFRYSFKILISTYAKYLKIYIWILSKMSSVIIDFLLEFFQSIQLKFPRILHKILPVFSSGFFSMFSFQKFFLNFLLKFFKAYLPEIIYEFLLKFSRFFSEFFPGTLSRNWP